jgi:hypothetical protein
MGSQTASVAGGTAAPISADGRRSPVPSSGSILPASSGACDGSLLSTPFVAFGDSNAYKLVPGGNFEGSMAGWSLGGGARVVSGNEPYAAAGSGSHSLLLPAGASVRTPYSCVNASYPSLRLFARTNSLLSTVAVSLEYSNVLGLVSVPVGVVTLSPSWHPSMPMITAAAIAGLVSGGNTSVAIRFTALLGSSQVDDVFIDPRMRF